MLAYLEKHGGGGYRPPYRPPHHTHAPIAPPSSGLGAPNIFKILLLAYLASLAVGLHLLNTSVNITSLSKLSEFHILIKLINHFSGKKSGDEYLPPGCRRTSRNNQKA